MTEPTPAQTFKDRHREIQELVRELKIIRNHNLKFNEGDPQDTILMFAEAALVIVILERFVRAVVGDATDSDTIYTLLQRAGSKGLLKVPWEDQEDGIRKIKDVRNTLLHGNYEQAARQSGCASVQEFFTQKFASEVEALTHVVNDLMGQIDPTTGERYVKAGDPQSGRGARPRGDRVGGQGTKAR